MMILIDLERDRKMYSRTQTVASSEGILQNLDAISRPTSIVGWVLSDIAAIYTNTDHPQV